jgi:hypothetical protein
MGWDEKERERVVEIIQTTSRCAESQMGLIEVNGDESDTPMPECPGDFECHHCKE